MKAAFIYTYCVFAAGLIFGHGLSMPFTKDAVKAAYEYGRHSVVLEAIE